jgi:hypothetical protein
VIYQLFQGGQVSAWADNAPNPQESSEWAMSTPSLSRMNVIAKKLEQITLDDGDTKTISFANYPAAAPSEWVQFFIRVRGSSRLVLGGARLNISGKDTDNSSTITSKIPAFGNAVFPGIIAISSYNGLTFTLEGLVDGTVLELFAAICVEDDDARWTSLA